MVDKLANINYWDIVFRALIGVIVASQVWIVQRIISHEIWIARTESNRFTNKDAIALNDKFDIKFNALSERLSAQLITLQKEVAQIPKTVPPEWFKREVDSIGARVGVLEKAVLKHP